MKTCQACGTPFAKRRNEAYWQYEARKYCSQACARTRSSDDRRRYPVGMKCIFGDGKPARTRGMCYMHLARERRNGDPLRVRHVLGDDERRFREAVDSSGGPDACHPFTKKINNKGYGIIHIGGRQMKAHIYAYTSANGPVPPGCEVDHRCHDPETCNRGGECPHRRCCNPRHLQTLTHRANILRGSNAKLSDDAVAELYQRWQDGEVRTHLAREAGVSLTTLRKRFEQLLAHPDCTRWRQSQADAALARKIGGAQ